MSKKLMWCPKCGEWIRSFFTLKFCPICKTELHQTFKKNG